MPRLSAWLIRAALLYLAGGLLLGALLLANKGLNWDGRLWAWLPIHIELLLLGWTAQFTLGVAYWILPRFNTERRRERWAALAGLLLNLGVGLVSGGTLSAAPAAVLAGRLAEAGAALAFGWHAWPRVKPAWPQ